AEIWTIPGLRTTKSPALTSHLLEFHLGSGLLQLSLDFVGLVLGHAFLDGLWRALDQVLGLLEAQPGERTHFLDHLDLLFAGGGEHDCELGLLFSRSRSSVAWGASARHRSRGGHAPILITHLRQASGLQLREV